FPKIDDAPAVHAREVSERRRATLYLSFCVEDVHAEGGGEHEVIAVESKACGVGGLGQKEERLGALRWGGWALWERGSRFDFRRLGLGPGVGQVLFFFACEKR